MTFREGETSSFPFDRTDNTIWYFIIRSNEVTEYKSTQTDQKELLIALNRYLKSEAKFLLMGVWHGNWKTDIFVLDPAQSAMRLEDEQKLRKK